MFPERSDPTLSLIQKYVRGEQRRTEDRGGGEGEGRRRGGEGEVRGGEG